MTVLFIVHFNLGFTIFIIFSEIFLGKYNVFKFLKMVLLLNIVKSSIPSIPSTLRELTSEKAPFFIHIKNKSLIYMGFMPNPTADLVE